ncbi:hypothetical protein NQ318_015483 [Aromia moschata]|uniref:DDE Tnp4 domain-containing protein n=1 Tax=Aromia moschata TaxID=1265417 RepID=A0AAV8XG49_9CUCU|nr:hypothetical protein NQ318_015483 [Aromia moschata]
MDRDLLILGQDNDILLDLVVLDLVFNGVPRQIYIRNDHFNSMPDLLFFQHFRLKKDTILQFLPRIEERVEYIHNLNNSISPINQLLIISRFYATGCPQFSLAHFGGMHKSTVCRIIKKVTEAICHLSEEYIKMPASDEDIRRVQIGFFEKASFPRVIAVIDCTHVKIQSPEDIDAEIFRNRKGYFSLNVQVAVDSSYKFLNLVARWPGSIHDATIFYNSLLRACFERNDYPNCFLLGDSGYALKPYLLTPLLETNTEEERRYNESHIRTRVIVENTFGIWKRRFPILAYGCRTKLQKTINIIVATAILHNIARNAGEDIPQDENAQELQRLLDITNVPVLANNLNDLNGFHIRNELIYNYFSRL